MRAGASAGRAGAAGLLALACLLSLAAIASAAQGGGLPRMPTSFGVSGAKGLAIRPRAIVYTGDGTGLLGGASVAGRGSGIRWTGWSTRTATGTGFNQLNNCEPSCAGGKYRAYAIKIEAWRPKALGGNLVFTRLTIFYTGRVPAGEPRHYTFTDSYLNGRYGWGPPGQLGYCTHTHGQKPAAGCQNIHSLP